MASVIKCSSLFFIFFAIPVYSYIEHPGSRFPPTKGEVWPKPQHQQSSPELLAVYPHTFTFKTVGKSCTILKEALSRYLNILSLQGRRLRIHDHRKRAEKKHRSVELELESLSVDLTSECEEWPYLFMDESYYLSVNNSSSKLSSKSIWGILRGLETFSQLVHIEDYTTRDLFINSTEIFDFPRFSHRGILLDTSRHFISVRNILKMLDGMSYNKLNVFHWHIVDDQSFPYESVTFPTLSAEGAFTPYLKYSPVDVQRVIDHARLRGIRVMPEFDTPGHTRSWGVAYPQLLTECYGKNGKPNGDLGPINPANEFVYTFMNDLFKELVNVFLDKYVHLGGDEVAFDCWQSNPSISEFMLNHNIADYHQLEEIYIQRIVDMVKNLNSSSAVWQEVFLNGVKLPKGTVVHAWTGNQKNLLGQITSSGLPALLSTCWYLDHLSTGGDWDKFYNCDPHDFPGTDEQKKLVLGGEACMWSEVVDDNNMLARVFPRASATAEKLWSAANAGTINEARFRLEEQYCRMNKRGYPCQPPSGPGFCV